MKTLFHFLLLLFAIAFFYIGGIILYGTLTEFKPEPGSAEMVAQHPQAKPLEPDSLIRILNWNIGFSGLGKEMDFFYDGGKTVHAPRGDWNRYLQGMMATLLSDPDVDIFLLQEVDQEAARSYFINQLDSIGSQLSGYHKAFGVNYHVRHVPLPLHRPLGQVLSGVATYSRYATSSSTRIQYPGSFAWPTRIFFLDRCYLVTRIPLQSNHELVLVNTHNSAYDETGRIKDAEMKALYDFVLHEYEQGNYVIVGGDFNQCPPGFNPSTFEQGDYAGFKPPAMSDKYIPDGWQVCYDPSTPTNRHLDTPYDKNSFRTLIDFYYVSPNVRVHRVHTIDQGFAWSDHQPVLLDVSLLP